MSNERFKIKDQEAIVSALNTVAASLNRADYKIEQLLIGSWWMELALHAQKDTNGHLTYDQFTF